MLGEQDGSLRHELRREGAAGKRHHFQDLNKVGGTGGTDWPVWRTRQGNTAVFPGSVRGQKDHLNSKNDWSDFSPRLLLHQLQQNPARARRMHKHVAMASRPQLDLFGNQPDSVSL